jgi:hypothetical protein
VKGRFGYGWVLGVLLWAGCASTNSALHTADITEEGPLVTLRLTEAPDDDSVPQTMVQLVMLWSDGVRQVVDIGIQAGACHEVQMPRDLARVSCWWGPRQSELSLEQREQELFVFAQGSTDEERAELARVRLRWPGEVRPWLLGSETEEASRAASGGR